VPVTPGEVTSDHGWDLPRQRELIAPLLARAAAAGLRTAIFMDCVPANMAAAKASGAHRVELYTEPYARGFGGAGDAAAFAALRDAAREATRLGLGVNAGHDLDLRNTPRLAREVPELLEVSIGHALLADALYLGIGETIRRYLAACRGEDVAAPATR
jgi:pyridoxine 5-phosphate synthase